MNFYVSHLLNFEVKKIPLLQIFVHALGFRLILELCKLFANVVHVLSVTVDLFLKNTVNTKINFFSEGFMTSFSVRSSFQELAASEANTSTLCLLSS